MRYVLPIAIALLLVPAAFARNFKADISVDPAQPTVGVENTASGCGYVPLASVQIMVIWYAEPAHPRYGDIEAYKLYTTSDADGCFSQTWTPTKAGYGELWTSQLNNGGNLYQTKSMIQFQIDT